MKFELPSLPFAKEALEPYISRETLEYHYGKHHKAYVDKTNQLIQGTEFERMTLEDIIRKSTGPLFNNAAQAWNHAFYWNCLVPNARYRKPQADLAKAIEKSFGSLDQFHEQFSKAAVGQFGSGWAWLIRNKDGSLSIETTSNADTPIRSGKAALLTCDVWEHAYYIDYRNDRPKYTQQFCSVLNWEFAEANFKNYKQIAA